MYGFCLNEIELIMHTEKSICAVVVTFNRKALLLNCLNALNAQTHPLTHIVVI